MCTNEFWQCFLMLAEVIFFYSTVRNVIFDPTIKILRLPVKKSIKEWREEKASINMARYASASKIVYIAISAFNLCADLSIALYAKSIWYSILGPFCGTLCVYFAFFEF